MSVVALNVAHQQWIDLAVLVAAAIIILIPTALGYRAGRKRGREDVYALWEQAATRRAREEAKRLWVDKPPTSA